MVKSKQMCDLSTDFQALVSIGGRATRLRKSGVSLSPLETKSFMGIAGKPALHWTLQSLRRAGVSRIVLAGETDDLLSRGNAIAQQVGFASSQIVLYRDKGEGVHGLPHHARALLAGRFLFEAGHGMAPPSHYRRLLATPAGLVAYSTFPPRRDNLSRTRVLTRSPSSITKDRVVALPYSLDTEWNDRIAGCGYSIRATLDFDVQHQRAVFVDGHFEPEFDEASEFRRVRRRMVGIALAALAIPHTRRHDLRAKVV
jgi:hypothetical protein